MKKSKVSNKTAKKIDSKLLSANYYEEDDYEWNWINMTFLWRRSIVSASVTFLPKEGWDARLECWSNLSGELKDWECTSAEGKRMECKAEELASMIETYIVNKRKKNG